jgi:segregation and condensation protein A
VSVASDAFDESPLRKLPVRLALFEGPLDLLLHLCRENKVDVKDIPIAAITEQYLGYLDVMRTLNLEVAGEFLVVAATLLHIKSRLLLPAEELPDGEEGEDPRLELVQQLIEYQRFKEAGMALRALEEQRSRTFTRASLGPEGPPRTDFPLEVSLFDLLAALRRVIEQMPKTDRVEIEPDHLSVAQRISEVLERLAGGGEMAFEELFAGSSEIGDVVVTFLAVLELVRLRLIRVWQVEAFGSIRVVAVPPETEGGEALGEGEAGQGPSAADEIETDGNEEFTEESNGE